MMRRMTESARARWRTGVQMALAVALAVAAADFLRQTLPGRQWRSDFSHIYTAGQILQRGGDVYATNLREFNETAALGFHEILPFETNPPLLVRVLQPLAWFDVPSGFALYTVVQLLALAVVVGITISLVGRRLSAGAWALATGLFVCSVPVILHLWCAQVQLPLLALLMTGYALWRRQHDRTASAVWTLAGVLKFFPLVVAALPVLNRRDRRTLGWWSGWLAVWLVLPGPSLWKSYFTHGLPNLAAYSRPDLDNYSLPTFFTGLVTVLNAPTALRPWASLTGYATAGALVLWAWWRATGLNRDDDRAADRVLALLLTVAVLASPIAWTHYFVFLFFPLVLLAADARETTGAARGWRLALLAGAVWALNAARTDYVPADISLGAWLLRRAPLFVMLALAFYFGRRAAPSATPAPRPAGN